MGKSSTTEEFIEKAVKKFGDKFDYSKVNYIDTETPVNIVCPDHGILFVKPAYHLYTKFGCAECAGKGRLTKEKFIKKAIAIHGEGMYDYSKSDVTKAIDKVEITHVKCGTTFMMSPNAHTSNEKGCPKCADHKYTLEDVISKVMSKNPVISNINCSNYINTESKCNVTCVNSHEWTTKATNLLRGTSCPVCTVSGFKTNKNAILYILSINGEHSFTGFGITNIWRKRRTQHKKNLKSNHCSIQYEILIESDGKTIQALEQYVKQTLHCNNSNIAGFKTESVLISPEELKIFCENYLQKECASYKIVVNR